MDTVSCLSLKFDNSKNKCFYSESHFKIESLINSSEDFLNNDLLSDKYISGENYSNVLVGPIDKSKLDKNDLKVFTFEQLKEEFNNYIFSDYWIYINEDLKKYFNQCITFLKELPDLSDFTFYYINSDYLDKAKLDDFFREVYEFFIILFAVKDSSIFRFTFGYD